MEDLVGGKSIRDEMAAFCAKLSVTLDCAAFDDDELRGLDLELVQSMGVDRAPAARIVAKLRGLMEARRPAAAAAAASRTRPSESSSDDDWD